MRSPRRRLGLVPAACCVAIAAACLVAGPAQAATNSYPAGQGTFTGGPQGWVVTDASCNVPALCTAEGGYDGTDGNPAGSFAANTNIALNLSGLFKSTVTVQSPDFTVAEAGDSTLHLDRQFVSGQVANLAPESTYTVTLIDRTSGKKTEALKETITAPSAFTGKDAAVTVKAGHTYAISIATETSSTVAGTGLIGGAVSTRFDNVSVQVQTAGGAGSGNGGSLTDKQLATLMQSSLIGPAILKGNRIFVKAKCPAKVGRACRVSVQGLLKKGKAATTKRTAKIAKGKTKRLVLKVKPKAKAKVAKSKHLLFKETVKAGSAKATVYKQLKLIKR
jgi:hypothetical protein